jgi:hypothetical protein
MVEMGRYLVCTEEAGNAYKRLIAKLSRSPLGRLAADRDNIKIDFKN